MCLSKHNAILTTDHSREEFFAQWGGVLPGTEEADDNSGNIDVVQLEALSQLV